MSAFFHSVAGFSRSLTSRVREDPVAFLLKPTIKCVVAIGLLSVAAQTLYERSLDRQGLGKLAGASAKPPAKGAAKR